MTKKSPGLQCNQCSKWIHASCASISTDQLSALRATDSVVWKCQSCSGNTRPKRLSCILPDADDDEIEAEALTSNVSAQIIAEIRREVRETIRIEIQTSMQFYSDKIDDYEEKIKSFDNRVKALDNQCYDLKNQMKNLQRRNEALEQRVATLDQDNLADCLEICGIEEKENEIVGDVTSAVCQAWKLDPNDIIKAYRKKNRARNNTKNLQSPAIFVKLREGRREKWLLASKDQRKSSKDVGIGRDDSKIYFRESLSPHTAYLLWKAKSILQDSELFRYVWCKNGHVLARRADKEKVTAIHSERDIERLQMMSHRGETS